ncbi:lysine-rich arabinogalactan protein 19-like [Ananas comosus]|uniref:Lysine-rich arabinogalactan protein 19-like n=1 Tax=Ananas comosus TaxID=4615 RepID=A0A6P5G6U1_ANACO|nr:lysine-rich arabinogalactan protein 19-like [Ananas comosus]
MEFLKKPSPSSDPRFSTPPPYMAELRIESSPSAVAFSEPCSYCGSRKRRCLHPATTARKKLLVLESPPSPSSSATSAADAGLSPSLSPLRPCPGSPYLRSKSFPPAASPSTSSCVVDPPIANPAAAAISPDPNATPHHPCCTPIPPISPPAAAPATPLHRSASCAADHAVISSAEKNKKEQVDGAATGAAVRVSVSCGCGVTREVVFVHSR